MKKATFTYKFLDSTIEDERERAELAKGYKVYGLVSKHFGIFNAKSSENRTPNDNLTCPYKVVHLHSGFMVHPWKYLGQAREFVKQLESTQFPVSWNETDYFNLQGNAPLTLEIKRSIIFKDKGRRKRRY